ncbi:MAG: hypothetical protein GC159_13535 [Phycisphaera sp.]|nr:hypothetical protein [Phycisphaera sp.]
MKPYSCYHCRQEVDAGAVDAEGVSRCPKCGSPLHVLQGTVAAYSEPTIDMPVRSALARLDSPTVKLAVLAVMLGFTLYTALYGNAVSVAFCLFIMFGAINGYVVGASTITAVFIGTLAAAAAALPLGRYVEPGVHWLLGTTGLSNRLLSVAILAAAIMAVVAVVCRLLLDRFLKHRQTWRLHNRLLGAGFGLVEGVALTVALIWVVISLDPVHSDRTPPLTHRTAASATFDTVNVDDVRPKQPTTVSSTPAVATTDGTTPDATPLTFPRTPRSAMPSRTEQAVGVLAAAARETTVGKVVQQVNPIEQFRIFVLSQKTLMVLNDPDARESFLQYPVIKRIMQYPAVQDALAILRTDPQMMRVIDAPNMLTPEEVRAMLDSPTLLEAIDTTDVLAQLTPDAAAIEKALEYASASRVPAEVKNTPVAPSSAEPNPTPGPVPSPTPRNITPNFPTATAVTLDGE